MNFLRRLFFTLWYFRDPPWDTGITPPELVDFIENHPPGRALDLGCGTGTNIITLAQNGWDVTGVDFVARAIRAAHRKARRASVDVDLRVGDVTRLDALQAPFDLVLDIGCFHGLSPSGKQAYIDNLTRLLDPDGTYLMYGFFKDANDSGPGLLEEDIDHLGERLHLLDRQDGTERGTRPSAWFTFRKPTA
jgi:SAM-dependent methyltransferase